ncbi:MAG TPA: DUF5819 family protein, partial [Pseudonocardiaceae bacterium]|nr:DUF5819 family protein [Pseudonocardiaceae bacterium]
MTCLVTGAILALHFVMTFLFVAPPNPISARAHDAIGSYMLPYFYQDWKLFAPNPAKTDPHLLVRARIADAAGQQRETSWLDITEPELARVRGHLLPDRVSRLTPKVAQSLSEAAARQEQPAPDQQQQPPTPEQMAQDELNAAYARVLASRAAKARWGEQVREIQIRLVGYIPRPSPFFGPPPNDPDVVQHDLPWSPALPVTPDE